MRRLFIALALALVASFVASLRAADAPIVILVSLDGWRYDYFNKFPTPNLHALAARGVRAERLVPVFPTLTFPNHYTIVTGQYPEHHGIVGNTMTDARMPERFSMSAATAKDAAWWQAEPVWRTAMRQGVTTASMFWPGSEVEGRQPTYWRAFDDDVNNRARVSQVLDWLKLPEAIRPRFVTIYFSQMDHVGHDDGPESPEIPVAARQLDRNIGDLVAGVRRLGLLGRTTFVVVSDHGMSATSQERVIFLDDYLDLTDVDIVEWGPHLALAPQRDASVDSILTALAGKHPSLSMYRREESPAEWHFRDNPRIQPIVGVAADGWSITSHARLQRDIEQRRWNRGAHGYDPRTPSMGALFIAAGPSLRARVVVPSLENIQIYDMLCRLLGIEPAPNDGQPAATASLFR